MSVNVRWQPITEKQGHLIREALDPLFRSFASCTDMYGEFGSPKIVDEWGIPDADLPILKAESAYQRRDEFKEGQTYPERLSTQYYIAIITEESDA